MLREIDLSEISDGKLYDVNDMVKADCLGCTGCSYCCEAMVDTIILNPLDVFRLTQITGKMVDVLLLKEVALGQHNGVILPTLAAVPDAAGKKACAFLNEEGLCRVHENRPDFCRLFPLGRFYENGDFRYFLQIHECNHPKVKTKVKKWIDIPDYEKHKAFILSWHELTGKLESMAAAGKGDKAFWIGFLSCFYLTAYEAETEEAFYEEFRRRFEDFMAQNGLG